MAYVSANWGEEANLQTKSITITPSAAWSSAYTGYSDIDPDSGYDGMEKVSVRTPMIRDNTLVTATSVEQPGTVYNGDYSQSTGSTKYLRVAPTKTGMAYTNSYLYLGGSSYMGNATAADVLSGKTFSSASGIQLTGTATAGVDTSDATATANDILYPKTAYISDGSKATGTIQTLSASSETISEAKTYKAGYYPDGWTVTPQGGSSLPSQFVWRGTKSVTYQQKVTLDDMEIPEGLYANSYNKAKVNISILLYSASGTSGGTTHYVYQPLRSTTYCYLNSTSKTMLFNTDAVTAEKPLSLYPHFESFSPGGGYMRVYFYPTTSGFDKIAWWVSWIVGA